METAAQKGISMIPARGSWIVLSLFWLVARPALAVDGWDRAAAELAGRIVAILGPGQAQLTVRNLSTIPVAEVASIRKLLEADLKAQGVVASGAESANAVRVTLSENTVERVWVAEITEGNQTQVAVISAGSRLAASNPQNDRPALLLQAVPVQLTGSADGDSPILSVLETDAALVVLRPEAVEMYAKASAGFALAKLFPVAGGGPLTREPMPRDPRGIVVPGQDAGRFTAYLPGIECEGRLPAGAGGEADSGSGAMRCKDTDDPWPIGGPLVGPVAGPAADSVAGPAGGRPTTGPRAFFNAMRNSFTGVVTPGIGVDLAPFYDAAVLNRANGTGLLVGGVDGSVVLAEGGVRKPVSGARDWGSDFALLNTACAQPAGSVVLVSGSGEAASDSLRAYSIPALEAIPVSAPLAVDGTVTATASSVRGVFAVVRNEDKSGSIHYEVLRVSAICD
jgi:hypothetical protein